MPRPEDYERLFLEQNPWHGTSGGGVPDAWAHRVERPLAQVLWKRLQSGPHRFELVLGPRRVGKTTAMYQTVRKLITAGIEPMRLWWLRLDHPLFMQLRLGTLVDVVRQRAGATADRPAYLFLDELTYAEGWDLWLKTFFDDHWPVRIAATSSSTAELRERRTESGVGRWDEQYLAPYLFSEYLDLIGDEFGIAIAGDLASTIAASTSRAPTAALKEHRRRFILTGGFPELLNADRPLDEESLLLQSQRTLRSDAVERAIYKDIPQAFGVDDPMLLERLLYTLAGMVTGILSPKSIGQNLQISQPTFDKYLSYLTQAFLVFCLPNYSGSEMSVQKRGRKLFFVDGAVRNAALQRGTGPLTDHEEMGHLLENVVASHLHALSQQSQVRLYYWRDGDDEVDLIYDHPSAPMAFEVASSSSHPRHGLRKLLQRYPKFAGRAYLTAPDIVGLDARSSPDQIGCVPLDVLLVAIGAHAKAELSARLAPT